MSKDANVEKLTEKHQQTQSAIKNLQKVEFSDTNKNLNKR